MSGHQQLWHLVIDCIHESIHSRYFNYFCQFNRVDLSPRATQVYVSSKQCCIQRVYVRKLLYWCTYTLCTPWEPFYLWLFTHKSNLRETPIQFSNFWPQMYNIKFCIRPHIIAVMTWPKICSGFINSNLVSGKYDSLIFGNILKNSYWDVLSRVHLTYDILFTIQWHIITAVMWLTITRWLQIFAHATAAQVSCYMQNFIAITQ